MSQPVVVINIYGGASPCGCGQAKTTAPQVVVRKAAAMASSQSRSKSAPQPLGESDPPCDTCGVTYTIGQNVIYFSGQIGESADGGFPITKVGLALLTTSGGLVDSVDLPDAKAGDDLSGTFTMTTTNAAQAIFSYTGADEAKYENALPVTIRPA